MKKLLSLFLMVLLAMFAFAPTASALENPTHWVEKENGYFEFVNTSQTYELTRDDFSNYQFEYKVNEENWKVFALNDGDTLLNQVELGNNYTLRTIKINNETLISGASGLSGPSVTIYMRYKQIAGLEPIEPDPTEPEPESKWVEEDGYMFRQYNNDLAFDSDTVINIDNINYKIVEYRIYNKTEETRSNWQLINVSEDSRLILRNRASGYSMITSLVIQDGTSERMLSSTSVNPNLIEYFEIRYKEIDDSNLSTVNDLPLTRGSIFDNEMDMGSVKFIVNGTRVQTIITYDDITYFLDNTFIANTNMSLFTKGKEIYYYTHEDNKYILINQENQSIFTGNIREQTFVPYTIWNLTTNELEHVDRFTTYMYSRLEDGNNAYAYFYVDEFIIDELLSVSLAYRFRYVKTFGGHSDYEEKYMVLEAGETTHVDRTTWQAKAMTTTAAATAVGLAIPGVRWPAALIGTAAVLLLDTQIDNGYFGLGNIEQIQEANIDNALKNELINAYSTAAKPVTIDPSLKVFKLHLGQFNKAFTSGIDIDNNFSVVNGQKGINIIEFTYTTDGKLYTINGENINIEFEAGSGTDGERPESQIDLLKTIKDFFKTYPLIAWIIVVVLFLIVVLPILTRIKRNVKRFIR